MQQINSSLKKNISIPSFVPVFSDEVIVHFDAELIQRNLS